MSFVSNNLVAKSGEDGQSLSPVYSLAVHRQCLWLLSGLDSGAINLQSVRHDEGKRIHCLKKHTSAVSVLNLAADERSVLSGSWDRTVMDWDLNTGQVVRTFDGSGGQISALEMRPFSSLPVPEFSGNVNTSSNTLSSDSALGPRAGQGDGVGSFAGDGVDASGFQNGAPNTGTSPSGSLCGENDHDSLFGDNDDNNNPSASAPMFGYDYDDEFSRAIADGIKQPGEEEAGGDVSMMDAGLSEHPFQDGDGPPAAQVDIDLFNTSEIDGNGVDALKPLTNGLPHADEIELDTEKDKIKDESGSAQAPVEGGIFLAASYDGSLRVWDKRKPTPIAKMLPKNMPPWCMGACWSPDGNFIYAGRRNGTVEEFSLHKGLRGAERTFRFPNGSGPVSAVRAMPNSRHLIW